LRKNPYFQCAKEKGDRRVKERESVLTEEEEFVAPVKSNKKKGKPTKREAQAASKDKKEDDSKEESVATVQQSNIKGYLTQVSPKRDLRHAIEGIQLPVIHGTLLWRYLYRYDLKQTHGSGK
jgi:hypothetical protein